MVICFCDACNVHAVTGSQRALTRNASFVQAQADSLVFVCNPASQHHAYQLQTLNIPSSHSKSTTSSPYEPHCFRVRRDHWVLISVYSDWHGEAGPAIPFLFPSNALSNAKPSLYSRISQIVLMRKEETCWKWDACRRSTVGLGDSETGQTVRMYGAHTFPLSNAEQREREDETQRILEGGRGVT
jgi:hypothetical protein